MYQNDSRRQCVYCLEDKYRGSSLLLLLQNTVLCRQCMGQFEVLSYQAKWNGYDIHILYTYNDFFRKLLFQYKGQGDYALKDTFLDMWAPDFKWKYRKHIVVIAPSSEEDSKQRGFNPNEEIVSVFANSIFTGIYKSQEYKQTQASNRADVKKILAIEKGELLYNQKLLLFDDVITSGSTLLACLALVKKYRPKSIEIVILATK